MINHEGANISLAYYAEKLVKWHYDKDIIENGDEDMQIRKLIEEVHEVEEAFFTGASDDECMKEVGDVVTVLLNLCERRHYTLAECLKRTYNKLSKRTGKKINGTFVKSEDL
jgi:uncharacterized protein YabN with tetrapyrrole methylase and pyrophosphatase domain